MGPKKEAESYRQTACELGTAARNIAFVSDMVSELDAAKAGRTLRLFACALGRLFARTQIIQPFTRSMNFFPPNRS